MLKARTAQRKKFVPNLCRVQEICAKKSVENLRKSLFYNKVQRFSVRFNKAQQDAFLPFVESGLVTFIGATTENPSFECNAALLSRAQVYVLQPLAADDLKILVERARSQRYPQLQFDEAAIDTLVGYADGDARRLLNLVEQAANAAQAAGIATLDAAFLNDALTLNARRFDKAAFKTELCNRMILFKNDCTSRAIRWHTDGYYNPPERQIRAMILHCVRTAASGGENRVFDHELAYLALRDAERQVHQILGIEQVRLARDLVPHLAQRRSHLAHQAGVFARSAIDCAHVLAEAESLCHRALILNSGRLAANDAPAQLVAAGGANSFEEAFLRLTTLPPRVQNPQKRRDA